MRPLRLLVLLILPACAPARSAPPPTAPGSTDASIVSAPPEEVWPELLSTYRALGLPLTEVDAGERTLGSSYTIERPGWFASLRGRTPVRCTLPVRPGGMPDPSPRGRVTGSFARFLWLSTTPGLIRLSVVTELAEEEGGEATRVESWIVASPVSVAGSPAAEPEPVYCTSTGLLERRIRAALLATRGESSRG